MIAIFFLQGLLASLQGMALVRRRISVPVEIPGSADLIPGYPEKIPGYLPVLRESLVSGNFAGRGSLRLVTAQQSVDRAAAA
jgi:hypothetical protein